MKSSVGALGREWLENRFLELCSENVVKNYPPIPAYIETSKEKVLSHLKSAMDPNPKETYIRAFLPLYWKWIDEVKP